MWPGKCDTVDTSRALGKLLDELERMKTSVRARVEHPFRVIKHQFGRTKVRYR
jgi:IS5 family transposase